MLNNIHMVKKQQCDDIIWEHILKHILKMKLVYIIRIYVGSNPT